MPTEAGATSFIVEICQRSTSGHEAEAAEVSIAASGEGVLIVVTGRQ